MIASSAPDGQKAESYFNASFILGGQIRGTDPRLFMIYPEGNFIECSDDTPFFQIGETKYGKPIIVRAYDRAMSFAEATKLLLVSFDSTLKSNLSVGLPLDLLFYEKDSLKLGLKKRIGQDDPYYRTISDGWSNALKNAFKSLPDFSEGRLLDLSATRRPSSGCRQLLPVKNGEKFDFIDDFANRQRSRLAKSVERKPLPVLHGERMPAGR